jgi:hypothetical protein
MRSPSLSSTTHRVHHAAELDDAAVACALNDPAVIGERAIVAEDRATDG